MKYIIEIVGNTSVELQCVGEDVAIYIDKDDLQWSLERAIDIILEKEKKEL